MDWRCSVDQADTPLFLGRDPPSAARQRPRAAGGLRVPRAGAHARGIDGGVGALSQDTLVATDGSAWATLRLSLGADRAAVEVLHDDLLPADSAGPAGHLPPLGRRGVGPGPHHRGVAVLMPAPDFDLVTRVAWAGRLLPEKATSFQPKPSIGVLIRSLRDE